MSLTLKSLKDACLVEFPWLSTRIGSLTVSKESNFLWEQGNIQWAGPSFQTLIITDFEIILFNHQSTRFQVLKDDILVMALICRGVERGNLQMLRIGQHQDNLLEMSQCVDEITKLSAYLQNNVIPDLNARTRAYHKRLLKFNKASLDVISKCNDVESGNQRSLHQNEVKKIESMIETWRMFLIKLIEDATDSSRILKDAEYGLHRFIKRGEKLFKKLKMVAQELGSGEYHILVDVLRSNGSSTLNSWLSYLDIVNIEQRVIEFHSAYSRFFNRKLVGFVNCENCISDLICLFDTEMDNGRFSQVVLKAFVEAVMRTLSLQLTQQLKDAMEENKENISPKPTYGNPFFPIPKDSADNIIEVVSQYRKFKSRVREVFFATTGTDFVPHSIKDTVLSLSRRLSDWRSFNLRQASFESLMKRLHECLIEYRIDCISPRDTILHHCTMKESAFQSIKFVNLLCGDQSELVIPKILKESVKYLEDKALEFYNILLTDVSFNTTIALKCFQLLEDLYCDIDQDTFIADLRILEDKFVVCFERMAKKVKLELIKDIIPPIDGASSVCCKIVWVDTLRKRVLLQQNTCLKIGKYFNKIKMSNLLSLQEDLLMKLRPMLLFNKYLKHFVSKVVCAKNNPIFNQETCMDLRIKSSIFHIASDLTFLESKGFEISRQIKEDVRFVSAIKTSFHQISDLLPLMKESHRALKENNFDQCIVVEENEFNALISRCSTLCWSEIAVVKEFVLSCSVCTRRVLEKTNLINKLVEDIENVSRDIVEYGDIESFESTVVNIKHNILVEDLHPLIELLRQRIERSMLSTFQDNILVLSESVSVTKYEIGLRDDSLHSIPRADEEKEMFLKDLETLKSTWLIYLKSVGLGNVEGMKAQFIQIIDRFTSNQFDLMKRQVAFFQNVNTKFNTIKDQSSQLSSDLKLCDCSILKNGIVDCIEIFGAGNSLSYTFDSRSIETYFNRILGVVKEEIVEHFFNRETVVNNDIAQLDSLVDEAISKGMSTSTEDIISYKSLFDSLLNGFKLQEEGLSAIELEIESVDAFEIISFKENHLGHKQALVKLFKKVEMAHIECMKSVKLGISQRRQFIDTTFCSIQNITMNLCSIDGNQDSSKDAFIALDMDIKLLDTRLKDYGRLTKVYPYVENYNFAKFECLLQQIQTVKRFRNAIGQSLNLLEQVLKVLVSDVLSGKVVCSTRIENQLEVLREFKASKNMPFSYVRVKQKLEIMLCDLHQIEKLHCEEIRERHVQQFFKALSVSQLGDYNLSHFLKIEEGKRSKLIISLLDCISSEYEVERFVSAIACCWESPKLKFEQHSIHTEIQILVNLDILLEDIDTQLSTFDSLSATEHSSFFVSDLQSTKEILHLVSGRVRALKLVQKDCIELESYLNLIRIKFSEHDSSVSKMLHSWQHFYKLLQSDSTLLNKNVSWNTFNDIKSTASNILKSINQEILSLIKKEQEVFPELVLLSDSNIIEMLCYSKSSMERYIPKLFVGISKIRIDNDQVSVWSQNECEKVCFKVHEIEWKSSPAKFFVFIKQKLADWLQHDFRRVYSLFQEKKFVFDISEYAAQSIFLAIRVICSNLRTTRDTKELNNFLSQISSLLDDSECGGKSDMLRMEIFQQTDFLKRQELTSCPSLVYAYSSGVTDSTRGSPSITISLGKCLWQYNWDYFGVIEPLVETVLSDQVFNNFSVSKIVGRYTSLFGPAGTGKSETIKYFGFLLGQKVVVYNCSESVDYNSVEKIISGLKRGSCWGCFDEYNRLKPCVLSAVASKLRCLLTSTRGIELFFSCNPSYEGRSSVPESFTSILLSIGMEKPEKLKISASLLSLKGYQSNEEIAGKLLSLLGCNSFGNDESLRMIKRIVKNSKLPENCDSEIETFCKSIVEIVEPGLEAFEVDKFYDELRLKFDFDTTLSQNTDIALLADVAKSMGKRPLQKWLNKVLQLKSAIEKSTASICVGKPGTGKLTAIEILSNLCQYKKVRKVFINPRSMEDDMLLGSLEKVRGEWRDGVITQNLREYDSDRDLWFILCGPVDSYFLEDFNTAFDESRSLTLANGERFHISDRIKFIFLTSDISNLTNATLSRCSIIKFHFDIISDALCASTIEQNMYDDVVNSRPKYNLDIVRCGLLEIETKLSTQYLKNSSLNESQKHDLRQWCSYWVYGSMLTRQRRVSILAAREEQGNTLSLEDVFPTQDGVLAVPWVPPTTSLIATTEVKTMISFFKVLEYCRVPYLLIGPPGTAKTMMVKEFFSKQECTFKILNFSRNTKSRDVIAIIKANMQYHDLGNRHYLETKIPLVLFCDEVNLAAPEIHGSVQVVEFLTTLLSRNGYYERLGDGSVKFVEVRGLYIIASCNPSTDAGRTELPSTFLRQFLPISVGLPNTESLTYIFKCVFENSKLFGSCSHGLSSKLISVYDQHLELLRSSSYPFYIFSPRDLGRVASSAIINKERHPESDLVYLLAKECKRVFTDRIVESPIRKISIEIISRCLTEVNLQDFSTMIGELMSQINGGHIFVLSHKAGEVNSVVQTCARSKGFGYHELQVRSGIQFSHIKEYLIKVLPSCIDTVQFCFVSLHQGVDSALIEKLNGLLTQGSTQELLALPERAALLDQLKISFKEFNSLVIKRLRLVFNVCMENEMYRGVSPALYNRCYCVYQISESRTIVTNYFKSYKTDRSSDKENINFEKLSNFVDNVVPSVPGYKECIARDYVAVYKSVISEATVTSSKMRDRLRLGVTILENLSQVIAKEESALVSRVGALEKVTLETDNQMKVIMREQDTLNTEQQKIKNLKVALEEKMLTSNAKELEAQDELKVVEPLLKQAQLAVANIDSRHLGELRSLRTPPQSTKLVIQLVLSLLNPRRTFESWNEVRKGLQNTSFVSQVSNYKIDNANNDVVLRISEVLQLECLEPSKVKRGSIACYALFNWLHAQIKVKAVIERIKPLSAIIDKLKLDQADLKKEISYHSSDISELLERINGLLSEHQLLQSKCDSLRISISQNRAKIGKAKALVSSFKQDLVQWKTRLQMVEQKQASLHENCLVQSAKYLLNHSEENLSLLKNVVHNLFIEDNSVDDKLLLDLPLIDAERRFPLELQYCLNYDSKVPVVFDETEMLEFEKIDSGVVVTSFSSNNWNKVVLDGIRFGNFVVLTNYEHYDPWLNMVLRAVSTRSETLILDNKRIRLSRKFKLILYTTTNISSKPAEIALIKTSISAIRVISLGAKSKSIRKRFFNELLKAKDVDMFNHLQNELKIESELRKSLLSYQENMLGCLSNTEASSILENDIVIDKLNELKEGYQRLIQKQQQHEIYLVESKSSSMRYDTYCSTYNSLFAIVTELRGLNIRYSHSLHTFEALLRPIFTNLSNETDHRMGISLMVQTFYSKISACMSRSHKKNLKQRLEANFSMKLDETSVNQVFKLWSEEGSCPILIMLDECCSFEIPSGYQNLILDEDVAKEITIPADPFCIQNVELVTSVIERNWMSLRNQKMLLTCQARASLPESFFNDCYKIYIQNENNFACIVTYKVEEFDNVLERLEALGLALLGLRVILVWAGMFVKVENFTSTHHLDALLKQLLVNRGGYDFDYVYDFLVTSLSSDPELRKVLRELWLEKEKLTRSSLTSDYLSQLIEKINIL